MEIQQNLQSFGKKCQSRNKFFEILYLPGHAYSWNLILYNGQFEFFKFSQKKEGSDFSHKIGRVGKIREVVLKKGGSYLFS